MYRIVWTLEASDDYISNIYYLENNFPESVVFSFIEQVDNVIRIIRTDPFVFRNSDFRDVHQVPVVPQITLFYRVTKSEEVVIVRFWNNYQNKNRLKL